MGTRESDLGALKDSDKPVIGCLPLYPPLELLHSMGLVPVVLWGLRDFVPGTGDADRHIQTFACSVARHLAQFVMDEGREYLDGLLFYNACDTLRNLPEILREGLAANGASLPMFRLHVPMTSPGQADASGYLHEEIINLIGSLEAAYGVRFSEESFAQSVSLYDRLRQLCLEAEEAVGAGRMSLGRFCGTLMRANFLPPEDQVQLLESQLAQEPVERKEGRPVILSGILPPSPEICRLLDGAGLRGVGNDVAALHRTYAARPVQWANAPDYYAGFYGHHFPCSTLLYTADRRLDAVCDLAKEKGAEGFIFIGEKFCEYEYFELPDLQARMKAAGIASLALEFSLDDQDNVENFRTRIEAFAELLGERPRTASQGVKGGGLHGA